MCKIFTRLVQAFRTELTQEELNEFLNTEDPHEKFLKLVPLVRKAMQEHKLTDHELKLDARPAKPGEAQKAISPTHDEDLKYGVENFTIDLALRVLGMKDGTREDLLKLCP